MTARTLSANGLALLKKAEALPGGKPALKPYRDAGGWSIGYGHFIKPEESGVGGLMGGIDEAKAEALLVSDAGWATKAVNRYVTYTIMQNQFDALVSLCVDPDVHLLTADFRWLAAGDVKTGLLIWGIDEDSASAKGRKLRVGHVESVKRTVTKKVRVVTDRGDIVVSRDHRFLAQTETRPTLSWVRADRMSADLTRQDGRRGGFRHGTYLIPWLAPWESDGGYEAGYLAGFLDGEGFATVVGANGDRSLSLGFSQNDGVVAETVCRLLAGRAFTLSAYHPRKCGQYQVQGGLPEVFRFLGTVRSLRLIDDAIRKWNGVRGCYALPKAIVRDVVSEPDGEVISIQTSLRTYIADGFISHNCFNIGETAFRKSTLLRLLNEGSLKAAAGQFARWRYSEGEVSKVLVARREAEKALFKTT